MNFLKTPNLPEKAVKYVLCDSRVGKNIINELNALGCTAVLVPEDNSVDAPICAHPDIHMFYSGEGNFFTSYNYYQKFNEDIKSLLAKEVCEIFNNRQVPNILSNKYPGDVLLNAVAVGDRLICNVNTVHKEILDSYNKILHVNQGYTKCSVCVVSSCAVITDDIGIHNAVKNNLDVLLVPRGEVILDGYNYGFFGGCCGKISKEQIAFYGDIKNFSKCSEVKDFCKNYNVECISLTQGPLMDFGSLIPIIE